MKIGMNLLLWTDCPTKVHLPILRQLKEWGFDGAEFPLDDMSLEDTFIFSEELKRLSLDATGIIAMPSDKADPIHPDASLRSAAVSYMKDCLTKASLLGAKIVAGPLYEGLGRLTGRGPTEEEIEWCVQCYRQIIPYAENLGIVLAGEPINRFETYFVNTIEQARKIVKRINSPSFGIHVDTCHGNMEELNLPQAVRDAGNAVKHVHISENTRGIPGTGCAVPQEFFQALQDIDYDGWLTIEAFDTSVPALASRLHIWREMAPNKESIAINGLRFIQESLSKLNSC